MFYNGWFRVFPMVAFLLFPYVSNMLVYHFNPLIPPQCVLLSKYHLFSLSKRENHPEAEIFLLEPRRTWKYQIAKVVFLLVTAVCQQA